MTSVEFIEGLLKCPFGPFWEMYTAFLHPSHCELTLRAYALKQGSV